MWYTSFSNFKPDELDTTSSKYYVYQRRNFQLISSDDGDYWQYEELKIPKSDYLQSRIKSLESENTQLQLALTELYELRIKNEEL